MSALYAVSSIQYAMAQMPYSPNPADHLYGPKTQKIQSESNETTKTAGINKSVIQKAEFKANVFTPKNKMNAVGANTPRQVIKVKSSETISNTTVTEKQVFENVVKQPPDFTQIHNSKPRLQSPAVKKLVDSPQIEESIASTKKQMSATEHIKPAPVDIWQQIRAGFQLPELEHSLVSKFEKWYAKKPIFLGQILERAEVFLPYILEEIHERDMPTELVLLPIVESSYNPVAFSPAGAVGLWQFMPHTGEIYGLKRDVWYEGRRDILKSTNSALEYLDDLQEMFDGDWFLALTSYNVGENRVLREIKSNRQQQKSTHFSALRLPKQTRHYVPKLVALRNIFKEPDKFGIKLPEFTTQPKFAVVDFDSQVDLARIAEETNYELGEFARLNAGLRRGMTPPAGPHKVLVPMEIHGAVVSWKSTLATTQSMGVAYNYEIHPGDTLSEIAAIHGLTTNSLMAFNRMHSDWIVAGDTLKIPAENAFSTYASIDRTSRPRNFHIVKEGESLSQLAMIFDISVSALRTANSLESDLILAGQKLYIPSTKVAARQRANSYSQAASTRHIHQVKIGETLWSIAKLYNVNIRQLRQWNENKLRGGIDIKPNEAIIVHIN